MRIEPARRRSGARVGLTPLIDVVFLLLVFFIIGGRLEHESRIRLASPTPDIEGPIEAEVAAPTPLVLLALDSETTWRFAGRVAAPEAILGQLAGLLDLHPALQVVLAPGPTLDAQGLVDAIDRVRALGVERLAYLAE